MLEWLPSWQPYLLGVLASLVVLLSKFYLDQARDERQNKPVLLLEDHGLDSDMKGQLSVRNIGTVDGLNVELRPLMVFDRSTGKGQIFRITSRPISLIGVGEKESFVLEWMTNSKRERLPEILRSWFFSRYAKWNYGD